MYSVPDEIPRSKNFELPRKTTFFNNLFLTWNFFKLEILLHKLPSLAIQAHRTCYLYVSSCSGIESGNLDNTSSSQPFFIAAYPPTTLCQLDTELRQATLIDCPTVTLRDNDQDKRRQITVATPPRSLNRPLHRLVS